MSDQEDKRDELLRQGIDAYQRYIAAWAKHKGFWDFSTAVKGQKTIVGIPVEHDLVRSTKLMLMVSELGECLEAIRIGDKENEVEELADCVIRILDYAGTLNLPLGEAIAKKMAVNEGRPYKHGKAF